MEFHSSWVRVAIQMTDCLLEELGVIDSLLKENLLSAIGLNGRVVDPKGFLASGTTEDISNAYVGVLQAKQIDSEKLEHLKEWMTSTLYRLTQSNREHVQSTTDLPQLMKQLRQHGLKLGVATADDLESTNFFLEKMGIRNYFDFVGTSDFYEKKPSASMMEAFCKIANVLTEEVAVVGDTVVDLQFAKNGAAGLAIGVLSGVSAYSDLEDKADLILPTVGDLLTVNGQLIWKDEQEAV